MAHFCKVGLLRKINGLLAASVGEDQPPTTPLGADRWRSTTTTCWALAAEDQRQLPAGRWPL